MNFLVKHENCLAGPIWKKTPSFVDTTITNFEQVCDISAVLKTLLELELQLGGCLVF